MTVDHLPDQGRGFRRGGSPLDVGTWRRSRLLEAGFPLGLAETVAADRRYDLHALLGLVDRGCPPAVAVRIADPVETDPLEKNLP